MKKVLYFFSSALVAMFAFTGCGDDDEPDFRDDLIGTYSGTVTYDYADYDEEDGWDFDEDSYKITVVVKKNNSNSKALDFFLEDDEDEPITVTQLEAASNGFAFKIEKMFEEDGEYLIGTHDYAIGATKYDGIFSSNKLQFAIEWIYPDVIEGEYEILDFDLKKN